MADEQVRFDIKVDVEAAIQQLQKIADNSETGAEATKKLSMFLARMSKDTKVPLEQLRKTLKGINDELARQTGQGIFSNFSVGNKGIFDAVKGYNDAAVAGGRFKTTQEGVVTSVNRSNKAFDEADRKARGYGHGIDFVRTALGTLSAVAIFQVLNALQSIFSGAIEQAKQFEATLYRIANVEKQLSLDGIEISVAGLKKGIEDIKKAFPIFSKEDIAELIGSIATTTKELGFNEEQILKLGAAVAILNVNSTETETLLQTQAKVTNSLISPQAKSIGNLGLSFGKAKIEAKAFEMQLLSVGETFADLTEQEKTQIKYQIVLDTAGIEGVENIEDLRDMIKESGGDFQALNEYLSSNAAKLDSNAAAWKDLQTTIGQIFLPFVPAVTESLKLINGGLNATKVIIIEFITLISAFGTAWIALQTGMAKGVSGFTDVFKNSVESFREELVNQFFKEVPEDAPQWFTQGWGKHIKEQAETATGPLKDLGDAIDDANLDGLEEKIEDIIEDTQNAREDLAANLERKLADLDVEYNRKAEDAERDYLRKVEDINRDYERDLAALKEKQRQEDVRDEEKYQLQLWELRMRFLMDLEDALHARDARQVIRLQKQYELDKEALEKKHALDEKAREEEQSNQREELERRRQERLEDARIEYEQKLADQQIAKQREQEDLLTWYAREQADIEEAQKRKLETLLKGWVDEKKITEENAAEVYGILQKYFGPGGLTDALYAYMMQSMIASTAGAVAAASTMLGSLGARNMSGNIPIPVTPGGSTGGSTGGRTPARAEGGTLIATRPTSVVFGEKGPEIASFAPINRVGKDEGKLDIFGDAGGGVNGTITVDLVLSPDLEARVVESSMDGVADIVAKVTRAKL